MLDSQLARSEAFAPDPRGEVCAIGKSWNQSAHRLSKRRLCKKTIKKEKKEKKKKEKRKKEEASNQS